MRKKAMTRLMSVVMTLIMAVSVAAFLPTTVSAAPNEVRNGVVPVIFFMKSAGYYVYDGVNYTFIQDLGDVWLSAGSGFFVGDSADNPTHIVTNYHVVSDYVEGSREGGMYGIYTGYEYQGFPVVVMAQTCELRVYYDDNDYDIAYVDSYGSIDKVDLAILTLRDTTTKRVALPIKEPDEGMVGEKVYAVGFPGNADNDFTGASHYGLRDCSMNDGSISKFVVSSGTGVQRINTNAPIHHGNSGGPLVDEEGYVVGVCTNVESNSPYANQIEVDYYAVDSRELTKFLQKNSIPFFTSGGGSGSGKSSQTEATGDDVVVTTPAPPAPAKANFPVWLIVLLIAVGVIVIAGVIVLIVVLTSSKSKKQAASQQAQINQIQQQNQMQMNQMQQQVAQQVAQATKKNAVVRPMDTQHGGKSYPVGAAPIMVGRDPASCTIVYKEGTVGVSGRHCTISFEAATGDFIVTDLRSTYGTCLMNGTKLQPNAPYRVHAGDSIYIGDKTNVIRMEVV